MYTTLTRHVHDSSSSTCDDVVSDVADETRLGEPLARDILSLLLTDRSALLGLLAVAPVLLLLVIWLCSTLCRLLVLLLL
jgi:hypothetical protein